MQSGKIVYQVDRIGTDQSRITEPDHWYPLPDRFITDHSQNQFSEALRSMQSGKMFTRSTGSEPTSPGSQSRITSTLCRIVSLQITVRTHFQRFYDPCSPVRSFTRSTGSGIDQSRITEPDHWHLLPDHFITDH